MVLEIKCWMFNRIKRIQHIFLVLDARKCWIEKKICSGTSSNMVFFFFYEMLDEISAFKRIEYSVQHRKFSMLNEMLDPFKSAFC